MPRPFRAAFLSVAFRARLLAGCTLAAGTGHFKITSTTRVNPAILRDFCAAGDAATLVAGAP